MSILDNRRSRWRSCGSMTSTFHSAGRLAGRRALVTGAALAADGGYTAV